MKAGGEQCNFQPSCVTAAKVQAAEQSEVRVDKPPSAVYNFLCSL